MYCVDPVEAAKGAPLAAFVNGIHPTIGNGSAIASSKPSIPEVSSARTTACFARTER